MAKHGIWKDKPDDADYPAARLYLSLLFDDAVAARLVKKLHGAKLTHYAAKDLLRASRLPLLDRRDAHVSADLRKVAKGKKLSPVLLVRGDAAHGLPLIIADGYHRICAGYMRDENSLIACCIIDRPK